ncbi:hypothetical protein B9Z65_7466 [Elsinoe australis]|uniref:Uncharacterized protein n=1 Tax=Elsinoe australis TaxID=40998 RepID=A0A2P7YC71_9PEZI|nr:hypothetical protein B9Z65_7466 [Elsinoe australis]
MSDNTVPEDFKQHLKKYLEFKDDYLQSVGLGDWKNTQLPPDLIKPTFTTNMPVLPQEDKASGGNITDQVAKESSESTASSHPIHKEGEGAKATIQDHQANPGIALSDKLPQAASKDELKARAEELNKK